MSNVSRVTGTGAELPIEGLRRRHEAVAGLPGGVRASLASWITRYKLRACASVGEAPRVIGRLWIHGKGRVEIGHRVCFDAPGAPIELYPWEGAVISIGDDCTIGGGTSIEATESIVIGARTRLGSFSKVMDNHFHPLHGDRNERPAPRPVVIEEDVTIGPCAIVLAGSRVTRGTSVASGTVVRACASPRARRDDELRTEVS